MQQEPPRPENEGRWQVVTPNREELSLIDASRMGGHLDKTIQRFSRCPPKFQDRLVRTFLAKCVPAEHGTLTHDCSGHELWLHVEQDKRSVVLFALTIPAPVQ